MQRTLLALTCMVAFFGASLEGWCLFRERARPVMALGGTLHLGASQKSANGALGGFIFWGAEERKGFFRAYTRFEIDYSLGPASLPDTTSTFNSKGGAFQFGYSLFFFQEARFVPFISGGGVFGWHALTLSAPPSGVDSTTSNVSYGFEVNTGVDLYFGSLDSSALRINLGYLGLYSGLAGVSSFELGGLRLSLGLALPK